MKGNCFCPHKTINDFNPDFLNDIQLLENKLKVEFGGNFEFNITSGVRCTECNTKAEGKPDSAHTKGCGIDIACPDSKLRYKIIKYSFIYGFCRIGIGATFIHLDKDTEKPQNVIWSY